MDIKCKGTRHVKAFVYLNHKLIYTTEIIIDKKKYLLVAEKDYKALQKQAALKTKPEKLYDIEERVTLANHQ